MTMRVNAFVSKNCVFCFKPLVSWEESFCGTCDSLMGENLNLSDEPEVLAANKEYREHWLPSAEVLR